MVSSHCFDAETRVERKFSRLIFRSIRGTLRGYADIGTDGQVLSRYKLVTNGRTLQMEEKQVGQCFGI